MKAVIDRFENEIAVLLVGESEEVLHVPRYFLPETAEEGSWLSLGFSLDEALTGQQFRRNKSLLDRLLNKKHDKE